MPKQVPALPALRPDWERFRMLTFHPVQIGILLELARCGGSAPTSDLVNALGIKKYVLLVQLNRLEAAGMVQCDVPPERRARRKPVWSLNHHLLHRELNEFIIATTPSVARR